MQKVVNHAVVAVLPHLVQKEILHHLETAKKRGYIIRSRNRESNGGKPSSLKKAPRTVLRNKQADRNVVPIEVQPPVGVGESFSEILSYAREVKKRLIKDGKYSTAAMIAAIAKVAPNKVFEILGQLKKSSLN